MGLLSWFQKTPEQDYEALLLSLSSSIQDAQQRLSEIKLRERRASLLFTLYLSSSWVAYAALWWLDALPLGLLWSGEDSEWLNEWTGVVLIAAPAVVGPFAIIFIRRIVKMWYKRKETAEEKQLRELRIKQRSTIEDIKKKTNYYTTRNLLERYDEGVKAGPVPIQQQQHGLNPSSTLRRRAFQPPPDSRQIPGSPAAAGGSPIAPGTPSPAGRSPLPPGSAQSGGTPHPPGSLGSNAFPPGSPMAAIATGGIPQPIAPPTPPVKQWYDRLADAVLGEDPSASRPTDMSKFALVCEKCFGWNGLVEERAWADMQYVCPKCQHFNPSPNSRRAGGGGGAGPTSGGGGEGERSLLASSSSSSRDGGQQQQPSKRGQHQLAQSFSSSGSEDETVNTPSKGGASGAGAKKQLQAGGSGGGGETAMEVDVDERSARER